MRHSTKVRIPQIQSCFVFFTFGAAALLLLLACPNGQPPAGTCVTDSDCPPDKPYCVDGECTDAEGPGPQSCETHAECPDNQFCNELTGQCQVGPRPCEDDGDCPGGKECGADGYCTSTENGNGNGNGNGGGCETAYDCDPGYICKNGTCEEYDDNVACGSDEDCPADHACNMGICEGCLNDAFCVDSEAGPKCATDESAPVPVGYCYKECGQDVGRDCPDGYVCDADRGGVCVPACGPDDPCDHGWVCVGGRCEPCTYDEQCEGDAICDVDQGRCIDPPVGCTQAECQGHGAAYHCDTSTGQCFLGCTGHAEGECEQQGLSIIDCNACPDGEECIEGRCAGVDNCPQGCPVDCGSHGQVCDTITCECADIYTPGPGNGNGNGGGYVGDPCARNSDCQDPLECWDDMFGMGVKTCRYVCSSADWCMCPSGYDCGGIGTMICFIGYKGPCE